MPGTDGAPTSATSRSAGNAGNEAGATSTLPRSTGDRRRGAASVSRVTGGSGSRPTVLDRLRRHAVFVVVLLAGAALRLATWLAFTPAFLVEESRSHLLFLTTHEPGQTHPVGYGLLELTPLSWLDDGTAAVAAAQHLLGLATAVVIYLLLLRWGVWRWLAALATVPVLLDASVLAAEHLILPDALLVFLTAATLLALGWRSRPGLGLLLVAGLLIGAAVTVRLVAEPLVLVAMAFALLTAATWRSRLTGLVAVVAGCLLVLAPYAAWYDSVHGEFMLTRDDVRAVADPGADSWRLGGYEAGALAPGADIPNPPVVEQPLAGRLVDYERFARLPEAVPVVCLALALLAGFGVGRARRSGMQTVSLLAAAAPVVILWAAGSQATPARAQLIALVLLPAAGALGLTALLRGRRGPAAARSQLDDIDRTALADFAARCGSPAMAPVVVVIAAYNEGDGLPRVLSGLPDSVCGLACDIVIVDDGSSDDTAAIAAADERAYVVACGVNRGQGAAMRLGYRVARDHGARFIITTDADGQYDTADFPVVLAPVVEGRADFVTGSRRLGNQHTRDRFRRTGVYVFAWIVSLLTGRHLTDTSFGLRAMRSGLTADVTLNQPQYQSSELLLGAHSHGYRILEVPGTMHVRSAGSTKKGGNLVYGSRYARVVFGTWWREGCPRPAPELAPALSAAGSTPTAEHPPGP